MDHSFYIPVLGLAFSVDTPLHVAPYGISSVVSIVDDELLENMRAFYMQQEGQLYQAITKKDVDYRAKRITAYLNLLKNKIDERFKSIQSQAFYNDTDLDKYFALLPDHAERKRIYHALQMEGDQQKRLAQQKDLLENMQTGSIDVNIMSKVDKFNRIMQGSLVADESSDALAALRGYAQSSLSSSLVLSAGMNPRLYSYLTQFADFYPDDTGRIRKKVILKVSDYRSALIQARFLVKKGIWVSEFRIESGLNCGGHAFATDGFLLGPILEEFKQRRGELYETLYSSYQQTLSAQGKCCPEVMVMRLTAQGGVGTSDEHRFLLNYYQLDAIGWGSPFLLVPETTNVDEETLDRLVQATADDFYVSDASPLNVPFNNFRKSSAEQQRLARIAKGKPGSPCTKKYLVSNTEFTDTPICTASHKYQRFKLDQLTHLDLPAHVYQNEVEKVLAKTCLCEGLSRAVLIKKGISKPGKGPAVAICPGPNLAWFSGPYNMAEMVAHIYGKKSLIDKEKRPHMFINELSLYIAHWKKITASCTDGITVKKQQYIEKFKLQLREGFLYYQKMATCIPELGTRFYAQLQQYEPLIFCSK